MEEGVGERVGARPCGKSGICVCREEGFCGLGQGRIGQGSTSLGVWSRGHILKLSESPLGWHSDVVVWGRESCSENMAFWRQKGLQETASLPVLQKEKPRAGESLISLVRDLSICSSGNAFMTCSCDARS